MEHFECANTECNAYMRDNQCMWRYGDNIGAEYKTCTHIKELLSRENDRMVSMEKDINELQNDNDISLHKKNKSVIELLEESAEEIENLYDKETDLSQRIRSMLNKLE